MPDFQHRSWATVQENVEQRCLREYVTLKYLGPRARLFWRIYSTVIYKN